MNQINDDSKYPKNDIEQLGIRSFDDFLGFGIHYLLLKGTPSV